MYHERDANRSGFVTPTVMTIGALIYLSCQSDSSFAPHLMLHLEADVDGTAFTHTAGSCPSRSDQLKLLLALL